MKDILTLGIETSCDETSASVVKNGNEVLSCVINSQIDIHKVFGGVVPEIASRNHIENIDVVVKQALTEANATIDDIDAIGVTYGAGLVGALIVGVSYAKALAQAANKPLIAVNHIQGHLSANYITHKDLQPPFISLMTSGGHTAISYVESQEKYTVLASTVDDAIGEAFDKVARMLGLTYPGGVQIDKLSQSGKPNIKLPSVLLKNGNFSYSGLKTATANYINTCKMKGEEINVNDLCASFTTAAVDGLITACCSHLRKYKCKKLAVSGGVSANSYLRKKALDLRSLGYEVYLPEMLYCTDNGAMIASRAYFQFIDGEGIADMSLNAAPTLKLRGEIKK